MPTSLDVARHISFGTHMSILLDKICSSPFSATPLVNTGGRCQGGFTWMSAMWIGPSCLGGPPMAKQGKCETCMVRYTWDRPLPLIDCLCPVCGQRLQGTTYISDLICRDLGQIRPLGKTRVSVLGDGQAMIYDPEKGQFRACAWEIQREIF